MRLKAIRYLYEGQAWEKRDSENGHPYIKIQRFHRFLLAELNHLRWVDTYLLGLVDHDRGCRSISSFDNKYIFSVYGSGRAR
jgi:hypothetical protein